MQNRRHIPVLLITSFLLNFACANAQGDSETEEHQVPAETETAPQQDQQPSYDHASDPSPAPTSQPQGDGSPADCHDQSLPSTNQPQEASPPSGYAPHTVPMNKPQGESPSASDGFHYTAPPNQPSGNVNSGDRSNRDTIRTNGPALFNSTPSAPLNRLMEQIGDQEQRRTPITRQPARVVNKPGDVIIENGDIADGDVESLNPTLFGVQPELVEVAPNPVDDAVVNDIKNLEKAAGQSTKDSFAAICAQSETLGASLDGASQLPEAAKCFDVAYQTRSRFVAPLDPTLLNSALGLAESAFGGDNFEIAVKWYLLSLEILDKWTPSDPAAKDGSMAKCLGGLAASYLAQGDGKSALPHGKSLYDFVKSRYGSQSAEVCWGAATLSECYRLSRTDDKVKPLQDEMFDVCLAQAYDMKRFRSMTKPECPSKIRVSHADECIISEARSPVMPLGPRRSMAQLPPQKPNNVGNQVLPIRFWVPPAPAPRAVVVCIHGMCLHAGSYAALADSLRDRGILVVALDVRGLGTWVNSFGQRFLNLEGTLGDIHNVVERMHGLLPNTPIFMLGESMGGGIALHASARNPEHLSGVISSVPGASRYNQAKETLMVILNLPFGLSRPLNIGDSLLKKATANPSLRQVWKSDPLAKKMLSPKELISFQQFMSDNSKFAVKIKSKPVLVIQGMDDHLVKPFSTFKLYKQISSNNKTLFKVNSGEHLTFEMNQCSPIVLDQLVNWVQRNSR
jgi:acylglycerol lipase